MKTKKRNPADLTKRNNDARKKKEASLEKRVRSLERICDINTSQITYMLDVLYEAIQPKRSRK